MSRFRIALVQPLTAPPPDVRALRAGRDGNDATPGCGAKQGVLSEQWQRPELYDSFYPRPAAPALRRAAE